MKIIVSSAAEQELMERFLELFNEINGTELVEEIDKEEIDEIPNYSAEIKSDEYRFIRDGFQNYELEVGETCHMATEDDVIIGTCRECGIKTEGIEDGGEVTYDDYREQMSQESQKNWLCETCRLAAEEEEE